MPSKPKNKTHTNAHNRAQSKTSRKAKRDVELTYPVDQFVSKLRRLADCLEQDQSFTISLGGERVRVPRHAVCNIEHERGKSEEEIEFQLKWKL